MKLAGVPEVLPGAGQKKPPAQGLQAAEPKAENWPGLHSPLQAAVVIPEALP